MTKFAKRAWVAFVTVDALLLVGTGSAMGAQFGAPAMHVHLPSVLLGGLGLLVTGMTGQRLRR